MGFDCLKAANTLRKDNSLFTIVVMVFIYETLCAIRYHLHNLKNVKTAMEECYI